MSKLEVTGTEGNQVGKREGKTRNTLTFAANLPGSMNILLKSTRLARKAQRPWAARWSRKAIRGRVSSEAEQEAALWGTGELRPGRVMEERVSCVARAGVAGPWGYFWYCEIWFMSRK